VVALDWLERAKSGAVLDADTLWEGAGAFVAVDCGLAVPALADAGVDGTVGREAACCSFLTFQMLGTGAFGVACCCAVAPEASLRSGSLDRRLSPFALPVTADEVMADALGNDEPVSEFIAFLDASTPLGGVDLTAEVKAPVEVDDTGPVDADAM
jgi:hypothetical protein